MTQFVNFLLHPPPAIDLTALGGPRFVVLTTCEQSARATLIEHLVELGKIDDTSDGAAVIADIAAERVAVVW